jgi:hypothetical protein
MKVIVWMMMMNIVVQAHNHPAVSPTSLSYHHDPEDHADFKLPKFPNCRAVYLWVPCNMPGWTT